MTSSLIESATTYRTSDTVRIAVVVALLFGTAVAAAANSQVTPPQPPPAVPVAPGTPVTSGTTVMGGVHDSISGHFLRGAIVQLVESEDASRFARTVMSDSVGQFSFEGVPDGKYTLGFFHPMLDSLGMQPFARSVAVKRQGALRVDLAIPGARRMRDVICGPKTPDNSGAAVIGFIRDPRTRAPLKDVRVVAQWNEVTFSGGGLVQRSPRRVTTTEESGWFALCNVPGPGTISVMASRGADSTDLIEIEVPAEGFMRRELFLGSARVVAAVDSVPATDTLAFRSKTLRLGDARLTGSVIALEGGKPIAGAVVGILNGPQTRANDNGQWTLSNVPPGSRTIEVRAVGRVPVRRNVDVLEGTLPVRIAMSTYKAMLDTLKVTAGLSTNLDLVEFEQRRKSQGMGRFLTAADIYKRAVVETSHLFRNFPGLELRRTATSDVILMKGVFEEQCSPTIFLNGTAMNGIDADNLDNMVRPEKIIGVEVYSPTSMPPQFQSAMSGCGSIVIWARM